MKLLKEMTEPELRQFFNDLALKIEAELPPGPGPRNKCYFFLIVSDESGPGISQYVGNAQRAGAIKLLRETADRLEQRQDIGR